MATDKPRYTVSVDDELFKKIEDFRHENRYQTRSQATVDLIEKGLRALQEHSPPLVNVTSIDEHASSRHSVEALEVAEAYDALPTDVEKNMIRRSLGLDEIKKGMADANKVEKSRVG